MTSVSGTDFLAEAAAELYSSDPEGFTERRAALAAQARAAGDRPAAKADRQPAQAHPPGLDHQPAGPGRPRGRGPADRAR